jgi:hypothetical protein
MEHLDVAKTLEEGRQCLEFITDLEMHIKARIWMFGMMVLGLTLVLECKVSA